MAFFGIRGLACCAILSLWACATADRWVERSHQLIRIDGSSTVYPLTEAVVEAYRAKVPQARVVIGVSGTGGGFGKLVRGEADILDASRPIKASEVELSRRHGFELIELPVAYDGIVVAVNSANTWCRDLTIEELRRLWEPAAQGQILRWSQIRPHWPDANIRLFGPGLDSGTYDYFTLAIVGREGAGRGDFISSEDDNVLVHGVGGDQNALGFFSSGYLVGESGFVRAVAIRGEGLARGDDSAPPTPDAIRNGLYPPLSRPLFLYVRRDRADDPVVRDFVEFYLRQADRVVKDVGLSPLSERAYSLVLERFQSRITGSAFGGRGSVVGLSVENALGPGEG